MALTLVLFFVGIATVFFNPLNPLAISFGMFLVAISILNIAVQIYFPMQPKETVELKVIKVKTTQKPKKGTKKPTKKRKA